MFQLDHSYRRLPSALFTSTLPTPVAQPELLLFNHALAAELNLDDLAAKDAENIFSGNTSATGSEPIAQAYAGHQFGHATMLGDGRAVLLGEHITHSGARVDIQLKGAGRTPFSRGGDGRAALAPMLREYVISEALHALGVPSSRTLAVVKTGETVQRERPLPGAIATRIAASHLRIGTFQYAAWHEDHSLLPALLDYCIQRHYPNLSNHQTAAQHRDSPALALLDAVQQAQITLVVHWQRIGFIHGVLNTDNVTLSGQAIDFGPCAFMDSYDPNTVFSSIDRQGRYAFGRQPNITQWNLSRLAEALLPLIHPQPQRAIELATEQLNRFPAQFQTAWQTMMRGKLGLIGEQAEDAALIQDWLDLLHQHQLDYTNAHRQLMSNALPSHLEDLTAWHKRWQTRTAEHTEQAQLLMQQHNPAVIPRNHLVEQALNSAQDQGDMQPLHELLAALQNPYSARPLDDKYCQAALAHERVTKTYCGT